MSTADASGEPPNPLVSRPSRIHALHRRRDHPRQQIGLGERQQADQHGQHEAVEEDEAEDAALAAGLLGGHGGHDDALGVDHLAHHAARAVAGHDQHRVQAQLLGRDPLQAAEQGVARGVGAGQGHAQPAQQRREERIEPAGVREGQAQRGVGPAVLRREGQGQHAGDREQRPADAEQRVGELARKNAAARSAARTPRAPPPGRCPCRWPRAS